MKIKNILCAVLIFTLLFSLCSCSFTTANSDNSTDNSDTSNSSDISTDPNASDDPTPPDPLVTGENGFSKFDGELIGYLEETYKYEDNYILSPLSFKYALILATLGANDTTQEQLLDVLGFETVDACLNWAENYTYVLQEFEKNAIKSANLFNTSDTVKEPNRILNVANSIWHNTDRSGTISDEYIKLVNEKLLAQAYNEKGDDLMPKINSWVNEKTNGLIPSLFSLPLNDRNTILMNALYLKSAWVNSFDEALTKEEDFTTADGSIVKKDFMTTTEFFKYYKDDTTEIVILPLEGAIDCAIVIGDATNISEKIANANDTYISLHIPKFEIESTFDKGEFKSFLLQKGANLCLDPENADFSNMIDTQIFIDDIIQKAKIKTDEDGLEAAAVTAILTNDSVAFEPDEPIEVRIDKAFKFYIYNYNTDNSMELMFYGNYMK